MITPKLNLNSFRYSFFCQKLWKLTSINTEHEVYKNISKAWSKFTRENTQKLNEIDKKNLNLG